MKTIVLAIVLSIICAGCDTGAHTNLKRAVEQQQVPAEQKQGGKGKTEKTEPVVSEKKESGGEKTAGGQQQASAKQKQGGKGKTEKTEPVVSEKKESGGKKIDGGQQQVIAEAQGTKSTTLKMSDSPEADREKPATDSAEKSGNSTITAEMLKQQADMLYKPNGHPILRASDVADKIQEKNSQNLKAVAYDDVKGTFTIEDIIAGTTYEFEGYAHPYYGAVSTPPAGDIKCDKTEAIRENTPLQDFVERCTIPAFDLHIGTLKVACPSEQAMYKCELNKTTNMDNKLKLLPRLICYGRKKEKGSATETTANQSPAVSPILLDYFTWQDVVNQAMKEVIDNQNDCFQANTAKKASEIREVFMKLEKLHHPTCTVGDIIKKDNSAAAVSSQSCKIINDYKAAYEKATNGHLHFEESGSGTIEIGIADKTTIDNDIKADDSTGTLTLKVLVYAIDDELITYRSQPRNITITGFKK